MPIFILFGIEELQTTNVYLKFLNCLKIFDIHIPADDVISSGEQGTKPKCQILTTLMNFWTVLTNP